MPYITVKVLNQNHNLNAKKLGQEISEKSNIEISRINILIHYFNDDDIFRGSENDSPIITIEASEKNNKEFFQNLAEISSATVEKHLNLPSSTVTCITNPVKEGYMLSKGKFK
jgi:phenylpyruvate tautomerase PptA (4-oxalocrotonate tautomerase family)